MQQRIGERVETKFVPYPQVEPLKQKLEERDAKKKLLEELEQFAEKLVKSSKVFDSNFYFEMKTIFADYTMDLLPKEKRQEVVDAEVALCLTEWNEETIGKTKEIDESWINGKITFKEWRKKLDEIYK
ncbi:MAG: hypothetical protein MJ239_07190 [Bacilli bacterium]|nr:hypothetical protein [Bacilli bacterium]